MPVWHPQAMMKKHIFTLSVLLALSALLHDWQRPPCLTVITGVPDELLVNQLKERGVEASTWERGIRFACQEEALALLDRYYRFHRQAESVCQLNLDNAQTMKTASGEPYRRQFLILNDQAEAELHLDPSDFTWVYDPTHPFAVQEGSHQGYVALPNVSPMMEISQARFHREQAESYRQLIEQAGRAAGLVYLFRAPAAEELPAPRHSAEKPASIDFQKLLGEVDVVGK